MAMPTQNSGYGPGSHQQFHQYQFHSPGPGTPQSFSSNAQAPSASSTPPAQLSFVARLALIPEVRAIPWRPGQELPPEKSTESLRVQQRGAVLLATRGNVAQRPCDHCAAGYGRFSLCIAMEHWFQGACASCLFTSKGNKCSLRHQNSGGADDGALATQVQNSGEHTFQSYLQDGMDKPILQHKRKRKPDPQPAVEAPPYMTANSQLVSHQPYSPDLDTMLQAEIARELYEPAGQKDIQQQPIRQYDQPASIASQQGNFEPYAASHFYQALTQASAPKVNEAVLQVPQPRPVQRVWAVGRLVKKEDQPQEVVSEAQPVAITLLSQTQPAPATEPAPRTKQSQIYGSISGLKGGIDHLQGQLNTFKTLLGINIDDDDD